MTRASDADVQLELEAVSLIDGAEQTVAAGILSSLQPQNVRLRRAVRDPEALSTHPRYPLLFDPQTAGGLLASVPADVASACLDELHEQGYVHAAIIGRVEPRSAEAAPIQVIV
jgi:selenide,water dikinase